MIIINCDRCDRPFETDDDAAGEKVTCPYCGDVNRVLASASVAAPATAHAVRGVGAAGAESTVAAEAARGEPADPEREVHIAVVRQAMFRPHPFWYTLMVLLFLGGLALAVLSQTLAALQPQGYWLVWVGIGLAAVAAIWWLIWWAAPHRWVKLTITNKRTIRQEGIIMRRTSEVLHNHIRNVKIEQTFLQRLRGVGSIWIDSAGGSDEAPIEIEMRNVVRPYRVKQVIDQHRKM